MNEAYNMDCMAYMKTIPDDSFDIACVDPPYGDACSQSVNAERERERTGSGTTDSEIRGADLKSTSVKRTGGTWATKYAKKS